MRVREGVLDTALCNNVLETARQSTRAHGTRPRHRQGLDQSCAPGTGCQSSTHPKYAVKLHGRMFWQRAQGTEVISSPRPRMAGSQRSPSRPTTCPLSGQGLELGDGGEDRAGGRRACLSVLAGGEWDGRGPFQPTVGTS
jgi:hypothetical protein